MSRFISIVGIGKLYFVKIVSVVSDNEGLCDNIQGGSRHICAQSPLSLCDQRRKVRLMTLTSPFEPHQKKTGFLPMQKQRRRSAVQ